MECNKEEALRVKDIAMKKMEAKDFLGARKFALKAQHLYLDTENISQMICVCDVHCSAESKIFGNELDWYGILQIEHTADDILIKKQYRKLALVLHPDKNKFAGAEAAFKLIGEAQRVLLNKEKRSFYDMKCKMSCKPVIPNHPPHQDRRNFNVGKPYRVQVNFASNPNSHVKGSNPPYQESKPQVQSGVANGKETFWTQCPFCAVRYQYYKEVLNRALCCQSCKKPFIAYNLHAQGAQPASDASKPVFPRQDIPNVSTSKVESETINKKPASNAGFQAGKSAAFSGSQKARQQWKARPSPTGTGKRRQKQELESSETFESDSSLDSEEVEIQSDVDTLGAQEYDRNGNHYTRRSSRNKRQVSYNENVSDEEITNCSKKPKESGSSCSTTREKEDSSEKEQQPNRSKLFGSASASIEEGKIGGHNKSEGSETVVESSKKSLEADNGCMLSLNPKMTPDPTFHEYPDPEFSDFDKDREEQCFKVGQVWAAYDTVDAMPRFYAMIKKMCSPGFKLWITWLEPDPDDRLGGEWADSELPFSCGKFGYGNSDTTEDRLMFSHEVSWEKGSGRNSITIYPRKGETWALFKNWDAKWYLIPENNRTFEYEFVEILSEYDETFGICVVCLGKLKGFASLFCRKGENKIQIPPAEVLKFSHRVPSCRMNGSEGKDVPKGSFELDPASITMNLEEITFSQPDGMTYDDDLSAKFAAANFAVKVAEKSASNCYDGKANQVVHGNNLVNSQDIPDSEFYNFDCLKSRDKFLVNQVWALYSDIDGLPRYYGFIKKIDPHQHFKVHITWLESCNLPADMILWKEKDIPISCGQFKNKGASAQMYTDNSSFSHLLRAELTERKNVFAVYPRVGEVWALYRNWDASMKVSDLQNCDYNIVEVLEENASRIKVGVLEPVRGFNSVFKLQKNGNCHVTRNIPQIELLRFSHQIPSFRLTDEKGGSLRGLWELDPAALPTHILYKLK